MIVVADVHIEAFLPNQHAKSIDIRFRRRFAQLRGSYQRRDSNVRHSTAFTGTGMEAQASVVGWNLLALAIIIVLSAYGRATLMKERYHRCVVMT